jgi:hypothetical protein
MVKLDEFPDSISVAANLENSREADQFLFTETE